MIKWLTTKELMQATGLGLAMVQRFIKCRQYKKKPLIVRQEKITGGKGRPAYLILWDTTTNQPATQAEGETYETVDNPAHRANADGLKVFPKLSMAQPKTLPANVAILPLAQAAAPCQMPDPQTPNLLVQAQSVPSHAREELGIGGRFYEAAVTQKNAPPRVAGVHREAGGARERPCGDGRSAAAAAMAGQAENQNLRTPDGVGLGGIGGGMDTVIDEDGNQIDPDTGEIINAQLDPLSADDFEKLLELKLKNAKPSSRRALRKYYRAQYAQNGVVPNALRPVNNAIASCGKAGNVGRKRLLDEVIYHRFIEMVKRSADPSNIYTFATRAHRKVTYYHQRLEKEFATQIPINCLVPHLNGTD